MTELPYREVLMPSGTAKGILINFHGGGWLAHGPDPVAVERQLTGERWQRRGWVVYNSTYSPGLEGVNDAVRIYDSVRKYVGKDTPIIVAGSSAGGHLALMVAVKRHPSACIARGAPTDLTKLQGSLLASHTRAMAIHAFGEDRLAQFSPALRGVNCPVVLAQLGRDPLIPWRQVRGFVSRNKDTTVVKMKPGKVLWVHGFVTPYSLVRYHRAERNIIKEVRR